MNLDFERALAVVRRDGCLVYPTETLYAVGGDGRSGVVAGHVFRFKARDEAKPLPLLLGSIDQLALVTEDPGEAVLRLAGRFWPGPLSILVRARPDMPPHVSDRRGYSSVRVTPHPLAACLCRESGAPLIATSANISGRPATADPARLDPELVDQVDGVLAEPPRPGGGAPSTVVGVEPDGRLTIFRLGAVGEDELCAAGFDIAASPS